MARDSAFELHTLNHLVDKLRNRGDKDAIVSFGAEDERRLSAGELAANAEIAARRFAGAGIAAGDRVMLIGEPGIEWIEACLGCLLHGAVIVPVDAQLDDEQLQHILRDAAPVLVLAAPGLGERVEKQSGKTNVYSLGEPDAEAGIPSWTTLEPASEGQSSSVESADEAVLFYTSGTTGPPKGVPLRHRNIVYQLEVLHRMRLIRPDDRALLPLPLHHVYPFVIGLLTPLALGVPVILPAGLTGPQLVRALRDGHVTILIGVPRLYRALIEGLEARTAEGGRLSRVYFAVAMKVSSWLRRSLGILAGRLLLYPVHARLRDRVRMVASGGSPLPASLAHQLEALGWRVAIGYGLTETSPLLTVKLPGRGGLDSVGYPVPETEIRVAGRDDDGSGEVQVRGQGVFSGYRNLPDATREVFTEDGHFRTGDRGFFDPRGRLRLAGRISTMIVTEGGENIQPETVEHAYEQEPIIKEIGILQTDRGLAAVVVPDSTELRKQDISNVHAAVNGAVKNRSRQLPSYQRVTICVVTSESLPRTRLGKIRRHKLEQVYQRGREDRQKAEKSDTRPLEIEQMSEDDRQLLSNEAARKVWDALTAQFPHSSLSPDSNLQLDLNIDSMAWITLTLDIRRKTGVELSEDDVAGIEDVRDLLRTVAYRAGSGATESTATFLDDPESVLSEEQKRWLQPLGSGMRAVARAVYLVNFAVMKGCFRLEVTGLENLKAHDVALLAPNHTSYLDPFALAASLSFSRLRRTYWVGWKGAAFANPLTRFGSRLAQTVPVEPERRVLSSIAFGGAVLVRERNLIWFPEGGRSETGDVRPFRPGVGMLIQHYDVPVVPVYIDGAHEALPVGHILPRPHRITVNFGAPVTCSELLADTDPEDPPQAVAQALRERVAALRDEDGAPDA